MGRRNGKMTRRTKRGLISGHGNNQIRSLSGQFQQVVLPNSTFVYLNPVNMDSQRLADQAQSWSEFRFTKLRCELLPNANPASQNITLVVGFSPEIDATQPTTAAEITELAYSRWNDGGMTIPTVLNIPKSALINQARPWYQCNPIALNSSFPVVAGFVTLNPNINGVDFSAYTSTPAYQSACQGCFYFFNSSTTLQQNVIITYTIQFRDPGNNTAGPPRPKQIQQMSVDTLFLAIKEKKVPKSTVMEQLLLDYKSDGETAK